MTGTERKVFQKYYPPDFDPSKLRKERGLKRNRQFVQRVMTPFNMQCNTCHEYIYKGKKFNMKRETVEGETYLGLKLFRFYFKCPNCLAEITFKTDLENCDYQNEYGATRLFEAFKLAKDQARAEEAQEEEDKKDPMKMLEKRTMMSRNEMEALGELEDLQDKSRMAAAVDFDNFLHSTDPTLSLAEQLRRQEDEDEKMIRKIFHKTDDGKIVKRLDDSDEDDIQPGPSSSSAKQSDNSEEKPDFKPPLPSNPSQSKKMDQRAMLSKFIKRKKVEEDPGPSSSTATMNPSGSEHPSALSNHVAGGGLLGLATYGSDSDSD